VNLLLLDADEIRDDGTAVLTGRRARHVREVLGAGPGATVAAGVLGGRMGRAEILSCAEDRLVLRPRLDDDPPPASPVSMLLAMPRPKILRKVLQGAASMGVKRIVLLGSWRVERAYFSSPLLAPEALAAELRLGLEQGRDTRLPEVVVRRLFKPFVEDELDGLFPPGRARRLLAHPGAPAPVDDLPPGGAEALVAVGPEGGFTSYEAGVLEARGFTPFSLGPRALRVDVAVPFVVAQVEAWVRRSRLRAG
jgi:16S rRNA (uracil1498-N3)-methyltransferase